MAKKKAQVTPEVAVNAVEVEKVETGTLDVQSAPLSPMYCGVVLPTIDQLFDGVAETVKPAPALDLSTIESSALVSGFVPESVMYAFVGPEELGMFARVIKSLVYDCHSQRQREEVAAHALQVLNGFLK